MWGWIKLPIKYHSFFGMNIHLPAIFWCEQPGVPGIWPIAAFCHVTEQNTRSISAHFQTSMFTRLQTWWCKLQTDSLCCHPKWHLPDLDEHHEPKNAERQTGVSENGIYHGYTMYIPQNCNSNWEMMTQKPMDFRWFWGTPFSKHTQKSPCWLCIQLFPHGFPISIRGPILGLVWGQQLAHPHVSPVHAWRRWLLGWRMWMEMGSGRVWLRLISCHISNMHVYIR